MSGVSQVSSDSVSSAEEGGEDAEEGVTVTDLDISTVQSQEAASDSGQPRQVFYFYQSSDGQPIFLHALNVQMLVKQYGALEKCPPVIQAQVNIKSLDIVIKSDSSRDVIMTSLQILEKEGAVMSDQLRDRLRYLKHLPVSTNFEVAELELCGLVDKETMAAFREQVEARRRARSRKLREERRREKKIQQEEARLLGFPGRMVRVESDYCSAAASEPAPAATSSQFPAMAAADQEVEAAAPQPSGAATLSFANVSDLLLGHCEIFPSLCLDHQDQACVRRSPRPGPGISSRHHVGVSGLREASGGPAGGAAPGQRGRGGGARGPAPAAAGQPRRHARRRAAGRGHRHQAGQEGREEGARQDSPSDRRWRGSQTTLLTLLN